MTKRKTDGQRIAKKLWDEGWLTYSEALHNELREDAVEVVAAIIRKRCAKVWDECWGHGTSTYWRSGNNPYKGRKRKDEHR